MSASGRRLSLVLGILLAVVAFLGVVGVIILNTTQNNSGSVQVVVTTRDVAARETFSTDMLTTMSVPQSGVQPQASFHVGDIVGKSAAIAIPKGQQVTSNMLFANNGIQTAVSAYLPIPKGWVARAIPTSELQGVAGYIQAGDYINVIANVNQQTFNTTSRPTNKSLNISKTAFTNVRVIAVGPAGHASGNGVTSTLTIILTECDAEYFDWMLNGLKLTYTVLSYKDYGPAPTQPVASCPPTTSTGIGPDQVDARFGFTKV
ncbi:MAG TPA: Flp pilus assembly protein CpaB [Candidatus Dormibacteraeota bacterium]